MKIPRRSPLPVLLALLLALPLAAQTTNNDSSCDIGVTPAATLLLPYFEVDISAPPEKARTTIVTVVNTSPFPQIARATIWTDFAYPVVTFDLFLTGYDVASVNLYDVLASGKLTAAGVSQAGRLSAPLSANPNHTPTAVFDCNGRAATIPPIILEDVKSVLTTGRLTTSAGLTCLGFNGTRARLGSNHGPTAAGYVTIDVVATCSNTTPADQRYFTSELLFDNVLTGDWIAVRPDSSESYATASPLVHIRAIPEGGRAGSRAPRQLPYTFYGRLLSDRPLSERVADRRQPLPSVFGARFIEGGVTSFRTQLVIWREAYSGAGARCRDYELNERMDIADIVRFDEHENATVYDPTPGIEGPPKIPFGLPATSSVGSTSFFLPMLYSPHGDVGGWFYLNLVRANERRELIAGAGAHQAWVTMTMSAEGRYAGAFDAAALRNGCSPLHPGGVQIGPD